MLNYGLTLNGGNEYLGTEASITANEITRTCTSRLLAQEINHIAPLADEKTAQYIIDNLGEAIVNLMAQGYRVPLKVGDKQICSFYADINLKKTFNLAEAQKRDSTVTQLTEDCFSLITGNDIEFRAYAEQETAFTTLLRSASEGVERVQTQTKAKVSKSTTGTTPTGGTDLEG